MNLKMSGVHAFGAYCKAEYLQCIGTILGLAGAFTVSQNASYSKWGWAAFLMSNCCFIAMARSKRLWGFLTLQVGFTYTSINGLIRFF